jgi:hypothetical protein
MMSKNKQEPSIHQTTLLCKGAGGNIDSNHQTTLVKSDWHFKNNNLNCNIVTIKLLK